MTGCLIDRELVVFFVLSLFFSLFFVLGCSPAGGIVILHGACKCCTCSEGMGSTHVEEGREYSGGDDESRPVTTMMITIMGFLWRNLRYDLVIKRRSMVGEGIEKEPSWLGNFGT